MKRNGYEMSVKEIKQIHLDRNIQKTDNETHPNLYLNRILDGL
jgi:hypothetical protein